VDSQREEEADMLFRSSVQDHPKPKSGSESEGSTCAADAHILARVYRLPFREVLSITTSFEEVLRNERDKHNGDDSIAEGIISLESFHEWLRSLFSVPDLKEDIVKDAWDSSLEGQRVCMKKFFAWYVQNMFRDLAILSADPFYGERDALVRRLARNHNVNTMDIDKVKSQFDRFDISNTGCLSLEEFKSMLHQLLRAKHGDVSTDRLLGFWKEIDLDGSGSVDFSEFFAWYSKYFASKGATQSLSLVDSFYESLNPIVLRRRCLSAATRNA
jgi:hypothetical protein